MDPKIFLFGLRLFTNQGGKPQTWKEHCLLLGRSIDWVIEEWTTFLARSFKINLSTSLLLVRRLLWHLLPPPLRKKQSQHLRSFLYLRSPLCRLPSNPVATSRGSFEWGEAAVSFVWPGRRRGVCFGKGTFKGYFLLIARSYLKGMQELAWNLIERIA